jgi:putative oxidoreductase
MEIKLLLEERATRFDTVRRWLPRAGVAVLFLLVGNAKFSAHSPWIRIFEQIGLGQWFRYFTGILQVTGAVLVLIPRTFVIGILILACTMVGAMASWIFFLGAPFNAIIPGALLLSLLFVGGEALIDLVPRVRHKMRGAFDPREFRR